LGKSLESLLQFCKVHINMSHIWIVAAGALALAATAVAHLLRRHMLERGPRSMLSGVSEEWLSNARAHRDESW
jgi:hypothetical protein